MHVLLNDAFQQRMQNNSLAHRANWTDSSERRKFNTGFFAKSRLFAEPVVDQLECGPSLLVRLSDLQQFHNVLTGRQDVQRLTWRIKIVRLSSTRPSMGLFLVPPPPPPCNPKIPSPSKFHPTDLPPPPCYPNSKIPCKPTLPPPLATTQFKTPLPTTTTPIQRPLTTWIQRSLPCQPDQPPSPLHTTSISVPLKFRSAFFLGLHKAAN